MKEFIQSLLTFGLPMNKKWARIVRRAIAISILTFISLILKELIIPVAPDIWLAIFIPTLAAVDKLVRDLLAK